MLRTVASRKCIAGLLAACLLGGCAGWNEVRHATPAEYLSKRKPARARIDLPETSLVLVQPAVQADSVVGFLAGVEPAQRVAVPASEVRKLEIRGVSPTTRKVILGGSLAVVAVIVAALALSSGPSPPIR